MDNAGARGICRQACCLPPTVSKRRTSPLRSSNVGSNSLACGEDDAGGRLISRRATSTGSNSVRRDTGLQGLVLPMGVAGSSEDHSATGINRYGHAPGSQFAQERPRTAHVRRAGLEEQWEGQTRSDSRKRQHSPFSVGSSKARDVNSSGSKERAGMDDRSTFSNAYTNGHVHVQASTVQHGQAGADPQCRLIGNPDGHS